MEIKTVSMKEYSALQVGGEGRLVEVSNVEGLKEVLVYAKQEGFRVHILGQGTNSYFGDNLAAFLFVKLNIQGLSFREDSDMVYVTASSSEVWDDVVACVVEKGYRGIENLSYIPGTVGAAPVQNIGAYGVELKDVFVSCEVFDRETLETKTLFSHECHFGYRDSLFKHTSRYIILSITLLLSKTKPFTLTYKPLTELPNKESLTVLQVRDEVIRVRKNKLPEWKEYPNCGSFFKNPIISLYDAERIRNDYKEIPLIPYGELFKLPSAWLVEHVAHMKGVKVGNVRTWDKQPLVIVNDGGASADEVDAFAKKITQAIYEKVGIQLEQEVNRIG